MTLGGLEGIVLADKAVMAIAYRLECTFGNVVALGVLSPDAISSSAYGTEEILLQLLPYADLAACSLVLPITGVILVILVLVAASYRQVLTAYK
jgi:hypothetical protein